MKPKQEPLPENIRVTLKAHRGTVQAVVVGIRGEDVYLVFDDPAYHNQDRNSRLLALKALEACRV